MTEWTGISFRGECQNPHVFLYSLPTVLPTMGPQAAPLSQALPYHLPNLTGVRVCQSNHLPQHTYKPQEMVQEVDPQRGKRTVHWNNIHTQHNRVHLSPELLRRWWFIWPRKMPLPCLTELARGAVQSWQVESKDFLLAVTTSRVFSLPKH